MVETYDGSIKGKDYEIQWYDADGNYDCVDHCTTLEEFTIRICDYFWGCPKAIADNPTVYYNGKRFSSDHVNERVREVLMK